MSDWLGDIRRLQLDQQQLLMEKGDVLRKLTDITNSKKNILFFDPIPWANNCVDLMLATALKIRGHNVISVLCDGFPICEMKRYNHDRPDCHQCYIRAIKYPDAFDIPYCKISSFISETDKAKAHTIAQSIPSSELFNFKCCNVTVGKYAKNSVTGFYRYFPESLFPEMESVARAYIETGILNCCVAKNMIEGMDIDIVVTVGGKSPLWAPIFEIAQQEGKIAVNWEDPRIFPRSFVFSHGQPALQYKLDKVWEKEKSYELTEDANHKINGFLNRTRKNISLQEKPIANIAEIKDRLNLSCDRKIITLFTGLPWDCSIYGLDNAFEDTFSWIFWMVDYAIKRKNINFVVRCHPAEGTLPPEMVPLKAKEAIKKRYKKLPDNIKIVEPASKISSYSLAEISDINMVYLSTIGLEIAAMGKMPWVAAKPHYSNKEFTLTIESPEHLRELLESNRFSNNLSPAQIQLARRYLHLLYFRHLVEMPFFKSHDNPIYEINSFEEFLPDGNPVINDLCTCITENKDFIDVGLRQEEHLVSVIIPFHNMEKTIAETIKSVLCQSYKNWEIILIDDGSTDKSRKIAEQFAKERPDKIKLYNHEGRINRGASASRNLGFSHANGDYIAYLDADDIWLPDKLLFETAILKEYPDIGMVMSPVKYFFDPESEDKKPYEQNLSSLREGVYDPPELFTKFLGNFGITPCPSATLIRKKIIEQIGGWESVFRRNYTDQVLWAKISSRYPIFVTKRIVTCYRQHSNSSWEIAHRENIFDQQQEMFWSWLLRYIDKIEINTELKTHIQKLCDMNLPQSSEGKDSVFEQHLKELYEEVYPEPLNEIHKLGTLQALEEYSYLMNPNDRVLDVGCGQGFAMEEMIKRGLRPAGVTIGDDDFNFCRNKNLDVLKLDMSFMEETKDQTFNGLFVRHALEHSPMPVLTLKEFCRVLKPLGWAIVIVPTTDAVIYDNHYSLFEPKVWANLFSIADFGIESFKIVSEYEYQGETIKREYPEFQFVLRKKSKNESDLTTKNINFVNDYIVDYNYNGGDTCLTKEKHVAESFLNPISSKFGFDRGKPIDRYYIENFLNENKHFIRGRSPKSISISASQTIDFGNLRRLSPVSRVFGSDRMSDKSLPLCWYYIRQFLSKHAGDIKGRVLEMGDNTYTKMFGADHVTKSDVLHVTTGNSSATIIADLTKADNIPENTFDCIICTQTLQCIYDVRTAVQTLHRILKPGGVLLTSASGISQISRYDMDRWGEYWRFTTASFQKMFEEYWPKESIDVQSYGNVLVAISYLQGFVSGDLSEDEMAYHDDDYQMIIVARAVKPVNVEKNIDNFTPVAQETEVNNKAVCSRYSAESENDNAVQIITNGWDEYARNWTSDKFKVVPEHEVKNIGDEWTFEDNNAGITYGLPADIIDNFKEYINTKLLDVYLPSFSDEGLEIGPGGGRFTELLIPKTKILHLADSSDTMLQQLKQRFESEENLRFYHTDGMTLPALKEESLDYIIAIDVFVHFEPRLIYWYLSQMLNLLKPGGTCIIHYANALTEIGWKQFEADLEKNVEGRKHFASFGTMCPQMMEKFLKSLGFEIIFTDLDIIPRDAIAIFRKPDKAIKLKNIQNPNSTGVGKRINTKKSFDDPIVLLYHRVAVDPIDSQLLAVLPENFEAHLKELAENYTVLPLHQLLEEAGKGQLQPDTLAITFDDGYLDNLTNAVPLLEKYGLHATIFVVSGMVGSQSEFWWDALERIFLTGHPLPGLLSIQDSQGILEWDLTTARDRLKAYDELCEMLRVLSSAKIDEIVNQLLIWAGLAHTGRTTHRVVDAQQLKLLASSASVEIGSHSITHTRLSSLSPPPQQYEIRESKQQLESIIKKPVRLFSYPYGGLEDITKETGRILAGAGYDTGIANVQGSLVSPVDMYAVPRRLVRNWSGPMFAQWLRDEDKASLEAQTLSDRAQRIINSSLLPWSKQKQTIQPQNKAGLNNCFPVAPLGVLL